MNDINCLTQGDQIQQRRLTEIVLQFFKRKKYPAVKGELKDSIDLKKATAGDGDWEVSKVILGWIINTSKGTISLSPKCLSDLYQLLDISPAQQCMSRKKLERLIGKLRSMHLAIPSAIGHFYHIQKALTTSDRKTAYLSTAFRQDITY